MSFEYGDSCEEKKKFSDADFRETIFMIRFQPKVVVSENMNSYYYITPNRCVCLYKTLFDYNERLNCEIDERHLKNSILMIIFNKTYLFKACK